MVKLLSKDITIDTNNYKELLNVIEKFVNDKDFIMNSEKNGSNKIFIIYDRKMESGVNIGIIDVFMGRNFLPERLRIVIKINKESNNININVKGDVLMLDWNLINDKPKRRDRIRLELLVDELIRKIIEIN